MKWVVGICLVTFVGTVLYIVISHSEGPGSARSGGNAGNGAQASTAEIQSRQYTVLLDVSASRPQAMIAEGERYMDALIDQMNYGDRLVVLPMYEAVVNEAKNDLDISLTKPSSSLTLDDAEELKTARNDLKEPVHIFFTRARASSVMHTDILTTLSIASEKISDAKRNQLLILSDMLQSSKEFEFEHLKRMPPPGWLERQKQDGLVRPLYEACVVAIGGDPSTHEGIVVRDFWQKYFDASNANLSARNYRTTPPAGNLSLCD
jgi:hypothetical protein